MFSVQKCSRTCGTATKVDIIIMKTPIRVTDEGRLFCLAYGRNGRCGWWAACARWMARSSPDAVRRAGYMVCHCRTPADAAAIGASAWCCWSMTRRCIRRCEARKRRCQPRAKQCAPAMSHCVQWAAMLTIGKMLRRLGAHGRWTVVQSNKLKARKYVSKDERPIRLTPPGSRARCGGAGHKGAASETA